MISLNILQSQHGSLGVRKSQGDRVRKVGGHFKVQGATSWFFKGVKNLVQKMSLFEIQVEMWQKVSNFFYLIWGFFLLKNREYQHNIPILLFFWHLCKTIWPSMRCPPNALRNFSKCFMY